MTDPNPEQYMIDGVRTSFSVEELQAAIRLNQKRKTARAWQVCDEDVIAAETAEEAIRYEMNLHGVDREDLWEQPKEIDLARTMLRDPSGGSTDRITYAQAILECTAFPCLLASTEY